MSIGRNAVYNMVGFLVPTVLGLASIPAYIHLIGQERFGVLALGWLILGYFGVFDLGLGRATSQRIAALRDADPAERKRAVATSLVSNIGIGAIGAAVLLPVTLYLFGHSFDMSPALRDEALVAAPLIALALPIATTIGVLSGAMMGREMFFQINRISIISTLFFQLLPLAVAWLFGPTLVWLLAASVFARLVSVAMMWRECRREFGRVSLADWDPAQLKGLLSFGGWVVLTGLFGPLLVYTDRFLIGTLIGVAAVTVYTVPMDATKRLSGFPIAIANALFPRLTTGDEQAATEMSGLAVEIIYVLMTPAAVLGIMIMYPLMRVWLGTSLGNEVAPLGMIFIVAMWFNAFAQIPFSRLQAQGRPDIVTKVLAAELPFYLVGLWYALHTWGLTGAATIYLIRNVVDGLLLFLFCNRRVLHPWLLLGTLPALVALLASRWTTTQEPIATTALLTALALVISLVFVVAVAPNGRRKLLSLALSLPVARKFGFS